MALFKLSGLLFVFISFSGFGIFKALGLKKRAAALKYYLKSISTLSENVALSKSEAPTILKNCFSDNKVYLKEGKIIFCEEGLIKPDLLLLKEFFQSFGLQSGENEARRCKLYLSLLTQKSAEADENLQKLFKLYSSLGVLSGLFFCIFLA